ncbi:MAG TPA: hypothetical protein VGL61_23200 [Kofleriaceae bacterium]|jgi:hypothetical protein
MRSAWIVLSIAACQAGAPSQSTGGGGARRDVPAAPPPNVPVSTRAAAIALGSATPLAIVEIGAHGELSIANAGSAWDNVLPAHAEPITDVAALEKRVLAWARRGDKFERIAADEWTREQRPEYIYLRDRVGEPQREEHFRIPRTYFGHFPTNLARDRAERDIMVVDEPGRTDIARADDVDRIPPLAPLVASVPDGPAVAIARVVGAIGGAIAVRLDDRLAVLRVGYRFAAGLPYGGNGIDKHWDELVVTPRGVDVVAFHDKRIRSLEWSAIASLPSAVTAADCDVLVADGVTAQQLVDVLDAMTGRDVNLGVAPAADGTSRLDQLLAARHATFEARRIGDADVYFDGSYGDSATAIGHTIDAARDKVAACYDKSRPHMTTPDTVFGFEFVLAGGRVSKFEIQDPSEPELEACLAPVLRALPYPHLSGEVTASFSLLSPEAH